MIPVSHRVGNSFGDAAPPAMAREATPVRSANSSTLAIAVATTVALLSAILGLMPEAAPRATADDLVPTQLRGSLPTVDAGTTP